MKYMIASDIHGSAKYCKMMLDAFNNEKADMLLLLGDLLYHGPRNDLPEDYAPKQVIDLLNSQSDNMMCVRGNCEAEVDQMVLDFPIMADYMLLNCESHRIFVTHGHLFNLQNPPKLKDGDVLLHGHTHIPACEKQNGLLYLNPGSVSIPKEGSAHGYMTFSDGVFVWKTFDGAEYNKINIKNN